MSCNYADSSLGTSTGEQSVYKNTTLVVTGQIQTFQSVYMYHASFYWTDSSFMVNQFLDLIQADLRTNHTFILLH